MKFVYHIGFLCLSMSTGVFADTGVDQPNQWYVAPGVAYYHFSEKRDLQNTAMADASIGLVVSDQLSLEAFYGQAATEESSSRSEKSTRFYMYAAEGVYHFQPDAEAVIHPYLLAGISITTQDDNSTTAGNTTLMGINVGAGIEYFVNPDISLFADTRELYTFSGGKNDWIVNGGIKFFFGGSAHDSASVASTSSVKTDGPTGFYQLQEPLES